MPATTVVVSTRRGRLGGLATVDVFVIRCPRRWGKWFSIHRQLGPGLKPVPVGVRGIPVLGRPQAALRSTARLKRGYGCSAERLSWHCFRCLPRAFFIAFGGETSSVGPALLPKLSSSPASGEEHRRPLMEIPARIEQAVSDAVVHHLGTELGDRGLALTAESLAAAEAQAADRGAHLRSCVLQQCYSISHQGSGALTFESERTAARLDGALAYGAVTARVLTKRDGGSFASSVELVCALFNLGIGLVDGLCDDDAETGRAVLELVQGSDLAKAAEEPRARRWLRSALPPALVTDPTVAFTADIIEAFFESLHAVYPDDRWLQHRRRVGTQLGAALEAERQSVIGSADQITREELIECSRRTSVLPFQIIETLANGDHTREPSAGTLLGEAMWRVDDLVDLCQDARRGSLNGVLLAVATGTGRPEERDLLAALERLVDSTDIADAADDAAKKLLSGLQLAGEHHEGTASFLHFIQRYAGIAPRSDVMTGARGPTQP